MANNKKARAKRTHQVQHLAVAVDVRLLRQMEVFFRRLSDPRCDDTFSFKPVGRFARALEELLIRHHEETQDQALRASLAARERERVSARQAPANDTTAAPALREAA